MLRSRAATDAMVREYTESFAPSRAWSGNSGQIRIPIPVDGLELLNGYGAVTLRPNLGQVEMVRCSNGQSLAARVQQLPTDFDPEFFLGLVEQLRSSLMAEHLLPAEPDYNEKEGEYLQFGMNGGANAMHLSGDSPATHRITSSGLERLDAGAANGVMAVLWVGKVVEAELEMAAAVAVHLLTLHQLFKGTLQLVDPQGPHTREVEDGDDGCYMFGSLLYYVAEFLGVDPNAVYYCTAEVLRGQNAWMPMHTDPDRAGLVPHGYVSQAASGIRAGNRLTTLSGPLGGQVQHTFTTPGPDQLFTAVFSPAEQLHMVDSGGCTSTEVSAEDAKSTVRIIPFNQKYVSTELRKGWAAVRLAPIGTCIRARLPISCSVCKHEFGCPTRDASTWINHFGAAVQKQQNSALPFRCFDCMRQRRRGERSSWFR